MITVRKVERYTVERESEKATLDPEKFRNISKPFEGETEKDFLHYIESNSEEFYEDDDLWNELDEATQMQLGKLLEPDYKELHNTAWDVEDTFLQSGTEEGNHFEINETTDYKSR